MKYILIVLLHNIHCKIVKEEDETLIFNELHDIDKPQNMRHIYKTSSYKTHQWTQMNYKGKYEYPFWDPSLSWDERVEDLLGRLTLQEISDLRMAIYFTRPPGVPRLGIKPYMWITECEHGHGESLGTSFPVPLAMAATFQ